MKEHGWDDGATGTGGQGLRQQAIWYFWDKWLDASVGTDVIYNRWGSSGWVDSMTLPNGMILELTSGKGANWGGYNEYKQLAEFANENNYSVTIYHFEDVPGDSLSHQHVILIEKHETFVKELTVTKKWSDGENAYNTRINEIQVQLYTVKDGVETPVEGKILKLNKENNWTGTFGELAQNNDNNETIYYTVKEINCPEGYVSKIDKNFSGELGSSSCHYTITNILLTNVTVKKEWEDQENLDELRPSAINVELYANGNATGKIVELNESNNWTATFDNVYKYDEDGKVIEYSVVEWNKYDENGNEVTEKPGQDTVRDYTRTDEGKNVTEDENGNITITIKNNHVPEYAGYIEITGKVWEDIPDGKANQINGIIDEDETGLEGIKVILRDNKGNQFDATSTAITDKNGNYTIKVNYDNSQNVYKLYEDDSILSKYNGKQITEYKLKTAYVEFEYDGLKYTTVKPTVYGISGYKYVNQSRVIEDTKSRNALDKKYSTITSTSPKANELSEEDKKVIATTKGNIGNFTDYKNVTTDGVTVNLETRNDSYTVKYCNGDGTCIHTNPKGAWNEIIEEEYICENCPGTGHILRTFEPIEVNTIKNVNMGLYKREQPDLTITENISLVEVIENGKNNKFNYNAVVVNENNEDVQVQFANKQTYTYRRPVNPTSIEILEEAYNSGLKETMSVYVTYEVKITNESETLRAVVNSLINCFDNRYTLDSVRTQSYFINANNIQEYENQIEDSIYKQSNEDYTEIKLNNLNISIDPKKTSSTVIYLKYKVSPEAIIDLLNNDATLSNSIEIESYTSYYTGATLRAQYAKGPATIYAGFDKDSTPGNAKIKVETVNYKGSIDDNGNILKKEYENVEVLKSTENLTEYKLSDGTIVKMPEDDTDIAPSFLLCKAGEEPLPDIGTLSGVIFEDTDEIENDSERLGNGMYDQTHEKLVQNVRVDLLELIKNNEDIIGSKIVETVYSKEDGSYELEKFERGKEYYIQFTYGNDTNALGCDVATTMDGGNTVVNARNYKSTIIKDQTIEKILKKDYDQFTEEDKLWYTKHQDGYSVAVDSMKDRLNIEDLYLTNYNDALNMIAYTKPFLIPEDEDETYNITKFDFGIIERPRENLSIEKTITDINVTLANGQEIITGNPSDPNANINYVKAIGFNQIGNVAISKRLLVEMDTELVQGASLEIEYEIKVTNNNEIDYNYDADYSSEFNNTEKMVYDKYIPTEAKYYYFGDSDGLEEMKTTIEYVDYLNKDINYNENGNWTQVVDIENSLYKQGNRFIEENVYNNIINNYRVFREQATIEIGETVTKKMLVSKILANQDENVYDNHVEIIKIDGKTARTIQKVEQGEQVPKAYTPGNYVPGGSTNEQDDDRNDTIITPPTGIVTYIIYTIAIILGLIAIVGGITFIKKKVLTK